MEGDLEKDFHLPPVMVHPAKLFMIYALFTNTPSDKLSAMARDFAVALKLSHVSISDETEAMPDIDNYAVVLENTGIRDYEQFQSLLVGVHDEMVANAFKKVAGSHGGKV